MQKKEFLMGQIKEKKENKEAQKQALREEGRRIVHDVKMALYEDQIKEEQNFQNKKALIKEIRETNDEMESFKQHLKKVEQEDDQKREQQNEEKRKKKEEWM